MKWSIPDAEPTIDRLINWFIQSNGTSQDNSKNIFDIGQIFPTNTIDLYRFSGEKIFNNIAFSTYSEGWVYKMCNITSRNSVTNLTKIVQGSVDVPC